VVQKNEIKAKEEIKKNQIKKIEDIIIESA
jgi:hypothetical protein